MSSEAILSAHAIALSALDGAVQLLRILAIKGLVTADDVDQFAHSLTAPFDELDGELAKSIRGGFDAKLAPVLAQIHRIARQNERPQ